MPELQPPVVFVPGITASDLDDVYPTKPEHVWGMLTKAWERIQLHPDDIRYEQVEPARVVAASVFGYPYGNFISDLSHDLAVAADRPVPVYPFPHDWRQPLAALERQLDGFVKEVIARTALMRHYHAAGYTERNGRVDLVGHSMGGLVIAGYIERSSGRRVRKVATLGTPFKGSFEAPLKMLTGMSTLGRSSSSREREVARLTPALYHLLPRYRGAVTADPGLGVDLFRVATWQPSVVRSIAEQIRLHGLDGVGKTTGDLVPAATVLFQRLLDEASAQRVRATSGLRLGRTKLNKEDWLAVVGVGQETRVHLHIRESEDGTPFFDLSSAGRKNGYPDGTRDEAGNVTARPVDTGDGTVPYEAAVPPFLGVENLVCVTDGDFGYWEVLDRALEHGVGGKHVSLHSVLPAMNVVEKLVVCHLKGEAGRPGEGHAGVWGRRAPDLPGDADWKPPVAGLREKL
jgi:pimeloyl-ACP methyl ester carboxylesterase